MTEPEVLQLPERPALDAESAAAMAVMTELDTQLARFPDATVAFDPKAIARAVLETISAYPRIPEWTGDARELGGGSRPGQPHPDPIVRIVSAADGRVRIEIDAEDSRVFERETLLIPAPDAQAWFLAGLAACRAAGEIQSP